MKIVILAGGHGTRLWPLSRKGQPKQFLHLVDGATLLQKTVSRFYPNYGANDLLLLTRRELSTLVEKQIESIDPALKSRVAFEPEARGTMPAILFGLKWLEERGELDDHVIFLPSDHLIDPDRAFLEQIENAKALAPTAPVVAFGVVPSSPHTGYGYIECRPSLATSPITRFIEKPPIEKAKELFENGNTLWNAGIFLIRPKGFFEELNARHPDLMNAYNGNLEESFASLPPLSFDHAFMEGCQTAHVVPLSLSWSDVGSWKSAYEMLPKTPEGNVVRGNVTTEGTRSSLLINETDATLATLDIEGLVVVNTEDALLVGKLDSSQRLRSLVGKLDKKVVENPLTVIRPWGSYTVLEDREGYKVKRIVVDPGGCLSLQYHHHRSEHWVVVEGKAHVQLNSESQDLSVGETMFIPKKAHHRLANEEDEPLVIIETQLGDYVGEDDIVRLDDVYGRMSSANL